ncbi:hypothetical protein C8Q77DRAFT_321721 [Trametes polyzona]|nr:hypothetical protein C8Q77DRAFT_321721 [Trametes polyzona]
MYTHSLFTFSSGATTAAALLGRITAATYQCQPRRKIDAPEWDPSRDEIVKSKVRLQFARRGARDLTATDGQVSSRFGAVGRERSVGRVAHLHADPPRAHNEERILEYAASWRVWKDSREGMEALTEEFNPFNPVNVAARAAAEVRLHIGRSLARVGADRSTFCRQDWQLDSPQTTSRDSPSALLLGRSARAPTLVLWPPTQRGSAPARPDRLRRGHTARTRACHLPRPTRDRPRRSARARAQAGRQPPAVPRRSPTRSSAARLFGARCARQMWKNE